MKKIILYIICLLMVNISISQPPKPPQNPTNSPVGFTGTPASRHNTYSIWRVAPIQHSNYILVLLATGFLIVEVIYNTKKSKYMHKKR